MFKSAAGAIDIPLKQRDAPETVQAVVDLSRKKIELPAPIAVGEYKDEPRLKGSAFEDILDRMRTMATVMERSPSAFETATEETLRTYFLVTLNALFGLEGAAAGETFNAAGKTDILLRYQNENLFVVECKFWDGPAKFTEAIEQLLGYLTWRDSRAGIVLFIRG